MKILIVGLGSMGKRRARLTKGIDSSIRIAGVDTAESRRVEARTESSTSEMLERTASIPRSLSCVIRCIWVTRVM